MFVPRVMNAVNGGMEIIRITDSATEGGFEAVIGERHFGPFGTEAAAADFMNFLEQRRDLTAVTARDLYEGSVMGDIVYAPDALAFEFGIHPLREVVDWAINHDNGRVPCDIGSRTHFLPADATVFVCNAVWCTPSRTLPKTASVPGLVSFDEHVRATGERLRHPDGGELLIAEALHLAAPYIVLYRPDSRLRKDLRVLSGHSTATYAAVHMDELVHEFEPPTEKRIFRSSLPRDYQRELVYTLENRISQAQSPCSRWLKTIEDCRDFLGTVYREHDLGPLPQIEAGRANLGRSYFSIGAGIRLAGAQFHSWTVLHEAAHHIAKNAAQEREPGHGPTFVATFLGLLAAYEGVDILEAEEIARSLGVDVNEAVLSEWKGRLGYVGPRP